MKVLNNSSTQIDTDQEKQLDVINKCIKDIGTYDFLTQVDAYKLIRAMLKMKPENREIIFSGFNERTREHFEGKFKELKCSDEEIAEAISDIREFVDELI